MFKIGNDIVLISRMEKSAKNQRFLENVFTQGELAHCKTAQSLAGVFAAKEAYLKALGTGLVRPLNRVEIIYDKNNKPHIAGCEKCDISISHDGDYAAAVAIVWD